MNVVEPERFIERMEALSLSQGELARRVGVAQPTVFKILNGQTQNPRHLWKLAKELETTPAYLMGETDDPSPDASAQLVDPTQVEIAEIDLAYGMGGTYLDDEIVTTSTLPFARDWLRNFTRASPEELFFARGAGDSMTPTIIDSDIVLIDRSQDTPRMGDQIWAIAFGGVGMIKRLRPRPDGSVAILSDNPSVPEDRAVDDELFVIGRVVAVVRKI